MIAFAEAQCLLESAIPAHAKETIFVSSRFAPNGDCIDRPKPWFVQCLQFINSSEASSFPRMRRFSGPWERAYAANAISARDNRATNAPQNYWTIGCAGK